jgi:hypothetical protein
VSTDKIITEKEFQAFAQERLAPAIADPTLFRDRLKEVLDFAVVNESRMDSGANAYYDRLLDGVALTFEQGLAGVADSPDKRKMLRLIALTRRKHHRAENFLKGLGRPLTKTFPVVGAAKPLFLDALQSVMDLLFDATREHQHGAGQFASLSMLYWTVDELNVAFYLAERMYTTQTYSHLRTVHDLLDRAELFFQFPAMADVWGGADKKKILKELSPSAVRVKLGKPKFDALYDFFTERGMHGTFGAVQMRTKQTGKRPGVTSIAMRMGGVAWDEEVDIAVSCCILTTVLTLITVAKVYESRLHQAEVFATLQAKSQTAIEFLKNHLVKPLQASGKDVSGVIEALNAISQSLSAQNFGP